MGARRGREPLDPQLSVSPQFHSDPDRYVDRIRAALLRYDELQEASIAAIPFQPGRVLELGIGTGETTRHLLERFPDARVTGLDASAEMVFRARELGIEVRLARMEDPLPDGPWDLVLSVLSVHHLTSEQKRDLFRRVREQSRVLVLGDHVEAEQQSLPPEPGVDFLDRPERLAEWCDGKVVWSADDLAVVRATYD
jgi:tRNA (cmo5U34)-methyltransferase